MSENAIDTILTRRTEIVSQIEKIDRLLELYGELSGNLVPVSRLYRKGQPKDVVRRAAEILEQYGQPMARCELATLLMSDGYLANSKDPRRYLGTLLCRNPRVFKRVGGGEWTLA